MKPVVRHLVRRMLIFGNLITLIQLVFIESAAFASAIDRAQDDYDDAKKAVSDAKKDYTKCIAGQGSSSGAASRSCDDLKDQWKQAQQDAKNAKRKLERAQDQAEQPEKKGPPGNENCVECNKDKQKYQGKSGWESFADIVKAATPLGLGAMNTYAGVKAMNLQSSDYQTYASSMAAAGLPFAQNTNGYGGIMGSMMGGNNMLSMLSMMNSGSGTMGGMSGMSGGYGMMGGMSGMSGGYGVMGGMSGYNPYGSGYAGYNPYGGNSMGYGNSPYVGGSYSSGVASMYPASPYGFPGNAYPYANAYAGMNGSTYGGLTSYNPWGSNYNSQLNAGGLPAFYSNQQSQYGAQLRQAQQGAITSQDAQAAQQALYTAQTRYQQVLGNMSGSYTGTNYPYSTSYYGSGYGGTSSGYSYYPSSSYYSYYPSSYYGSSGIVNNPSALNAVRQ